jgi:hypothetical protein
LDPGLTSPQTEAIVTLATRADAKSKQAVMREVLAHFENSPAAREIGNDFDDPEGFTPPTDNWLNTLRTTRPRSGTETFAINAKTKIEDDWVSDVADRFKVLLVAQDKSGKEVTWRCGTVTEVANP